jgi:hypothetical protein
MSHALHHMNYQAELYLKKKSCPRDLYIVKLITYAKMVKDARICKNEK